MDIIKEINKEVKRAEQKHPEWPSDKIHAAAIVMEEAGELIRAAVQFELEIGRSDKHDLRIEAIHTAATAIRFLKNL